MTPRPPARGSGRPPEPRKGAPKSPRPRSTNRSTEVPLRRAPEGLGGEQVEGRQAVLELLRARRRNVRKIYIADALEPAAILDAIEEEARRQRVPVQLVSRARLDRDARTEGHQGVYAEADRLKPVDLDDFLIHEHGFLFVADGVTDPRNLGAMLRSADGAGVTGVVLPRIPAALDRMNKAGVLTVGLAGESRTSLYDLDLGSTPVALVVGGEESGMAQLTRKRCAAVVSIPQLGKISSLNAGVAASVAMFEVARQRQARR